MRRDKNNTVFIKSERVLHRSSSGAPDENFIPFMG